MATTTATRSRNSLSAKRSANARAEARDEDGRFKAGSGNATGSSSSARTRRKPTRSDLNGAGAMLAQLNSFTGKGARLIAVSGPGQDYVVAGVPDTGSTLSFLALAALALGFTHTFGSSVAANSRRGLPRVPIRRS